MLKETIKDDNVEILDFILLRTSIEQITKTGNSTKKITREEFIKLICGNYIKDVLFDNDISGKRFYIEDLTQLYISLGGSLEGINKKDLLKNIKEDFTNNKKNNFQEECEEILRYLSSEKSEVITLDDFVNIVTSDTTQM